MCSWAIFMVIHTQRHYRIGVLLEKFLDGDGIRSR